MLQDQFFEIANTHFDEALPFVLYRKPNTNAIKGLFQNDNNIHTSKHLKDSGFVFAPFNTEEQTVLIPIENSSSIETNFTFQEQENVYKEQDENSIDAKAFHVQLVTKAINAINNNEFKKVVLSRKETINLSEANPIKLFQRLLKVYSKAFVYCWYHPKVGLWLGATPETLISITGNRFTTMALAGTQKDEGHNTINWEAKEIEEQELVTSFIENNLKPLVQNIIIGAAETIKAGNLLHIKTRISGTINSNLESLIKALHPTPAVCGFPKEESKQFILKNENYNREYYTGYLGELNIKEKATRNTNRRNVENNVYTSIKTVSNLYVNLRCMQLTDSKASLYIGGGITKDSNPGNEWKETVNKTSTMKKVLF
ncbi:chorismate-binding protein [uncultured Lacinutrix sp.]|uniref:chorismate-binding protein n=1 Tax=uncultured Lacinutrix sp. TaxID=574032 RepID=UPI0026376586|nr:chorismate-binding protein [uncultured Lacinutrix sp.]